ncbi:MAG: DUF2630 family protein [Jatrophihabitans sp.]
MTTDDSIVLAHIHDLVAQEKTLRAAKHRLNSDDRRRLDKIQHELDRTWDLLRQRRAREEFGEDPDQATERSEDEVDRYLQ